MKRALAVVLCACALVVGCSRTNTTPAATVNGTPVTTQQLVDELEAISANKDYLDAIDNDFKSQGMNVKGSTAGSYDAAFVAAVLRRQILFTLVHQELQRRNLRVTDDCRTAAHNDLLLSLGSSDSAKGAALFASFPAKYQQQLDGWYQDEFTLQADLSGQACGSPDVAKEYFDKHPEQFSQSCVSLISVNDQNLANTIVSQARAGGDFAAAAHQFSTDQQTAAAGGDAGCHLPSEFPPQIATIVEQTPVGGVTDAIDNTVGGFVIIKVTDRKTVDFTTVAAQAEELAAQDQSTNFNNWLQTAEASAHVTVDPRYGTFDPSTFQITPPPVDSTSSSSSASDTTAPPGP